MYNEFKLNSVLSCHHSPKLVLYKKNTLFNHKTNQRNRWLNYCNTYLFYMQYQSRASNRTLNKGNAPKATPKCIKEKSPRNITLKKCRNTLAFTLKFKKRRKNVV